MNCHFAKVTNFRSFYPPYLPHFLPATTTVSATDQPYPPPQAFMMAHPFVPPQFMTIVAPTGQFGPQQQHVQQYVPGEKKLLQIRDPISNELIHLFDLKKIQPLHPTAQ